MLNFMVFLHKLLYLYRAWCLATSTSSTSSSSTWSKSRWKRITLTPDFVFTGHWPLPCCHARFSLKTVSLMTTHLTSWLGHNLNTFLFQERFLRSACSRSTSEISLQMSSWLLFIWMEKNLQCHVQIQAATRSQMMFIPTTLMATLWGCLVMNLLSYSR